LAAVFSLTVKVAAASFTVQPCSNTRLASCLDYEP
jgi:hypothetical protein